MLKAARNAMDVADARDDLRLAVQGAILAVIAYADALTIRTAGIKNAEEHQRLVETLRHAMGNRIPAPELNRVRALLAMKDESAYGVRVYPQAVARDALRKATAFAEWVEIELTRGG